jgi:hypothetical protein
MSGKSGSSGEVEETLDNDLVETALESGVDVSAVVESVLEEHPDQITRVQTRLAESELRSRINAAETEQVVGLVAGSRDRAGKNWPRRYSLVRSSGDHMEISSWSGSLDSIQGGQTRIPIGDVGKIRAEYDEEYDSWEAVAMAGVDGISADEFALRLRSVAVDPSDLSRDDEYSVVAAQGPVSYISPQTVFENGEPAGDGDVLMPDDQGRKQPHFEVSLAKDGDTVVRGHLEQQSNGEPLVALPGSDDLFEQALSQGRPEDQADLLRDVYLGEEVVLVGNVSSIDNYRNDDGENTQYVDVQLSAVVSVEDVEGPDSLTQTDDVDTDTSADDGGKDADDAEQDSEFEELVEDIETYCELTGESPESLTAGTVAEKISTVPDDTPESVLSSALDSLSDADADESAESADESEQSTDDSDSDKSADAGLSALENDDGTYHCPADGCLFTGSEAALYGHAQSDHTDDDPKDWVMNNA